MAKAKSTGSAGGASSTIKAVIDHIEDGGMAVVLLGDDEKTSVDVPLSFLPQGVGGGDHLHITFTVDPAARAATADRVKKLQDQLTQTSGTQDQKDFKL